MHQILFHFPDWLPLIGGHAIYSYGVMLVVGFFAAMQLARFLAIHSRIDPDVFVNAGLIALVTGVAGARLSHVLENLPDYTRGTFLQNLWSAVNISSGGLTFYGGFLLATPCTIAYGIWKKVPIRTGMDIVAPCLMVGLGFGRIGCFLNGCCYGAEANKAQTPWAVHFPYASNAYDDELASGKLQHRPDPRLLTEGYDEQQHPVTMARPLASLSADPDPIDRSELISEADHEDSNWLHPAQLYSTLTAWLIAATLVAFYTLPHVPGRIFAAMVIVESFSRYVLEMLRAEPAVIGRGTAHPFGGIPPQSFSMVTGAILFVVGIILWFAFRGPRITPGAGPVARGRRSRLSPAL